MEFPVANQRLYGEVSYKTVGVKAICSVFAWLGMHAFVPVFLFWATGFPAHNLFLSTVSLGQVGFGWVSPVSRHFYLTVWQKSCLFGERNYWTHNPGPVKLSPDNFSYFGTTFWQLLILILTYSWQCNFLKESFQKFCWTLLYLCLSRFVSSCCPMKIQQHVLAFYSERFKVTNVSCDTGGDLKCMLCMCFSFMAEGRNRLVLVSSRTYFSTHERTKF